MDKVGAGKKIPHEFWRPRRDFLSSVSVIFVLLAFWLRYFPCSSNIFLTQQSNCQPLEAVATPLFGLRFRLHPWHSQLGFSPQVYTIVRTGSTMLLAQYSLVHDKNCWLVNHRCQAFLMGQFVHQDWKLRFQSTGITVTCLTVLIDFVCNTFQQDYNLPTVPIPVATPRVSEFARPPGVRGRLDTWPKDFSPVWRVAHGLMGFRSEPTESDRG